MPPNSPENQREEPPEAPETPATPEASSNPENQNSQVAASETLAHSAGRLVAEFGRNAGSFGRFVKKNWIVVGLAASSVVAYFERSSSSVPDAPPPVPAVEQKAPVLPEKVAPPTEPVAQKPSGTYNERSRRARERRKDVVENSDMVSVLEENGDAQHEQEVRTQEDAKFMKDLRKGFIKKANIEAVENGGFAVDLGGVDYKVYDVTPEDLADIKGIENGYSEARAKMGGIFAAGEADPKIRAEVGMRVEKKIREDCKELPEDKIPEGIKKKMEERKEATAVKYLHDSTHSTYKEIKKVFKSAEGESQEEKIENALKTLRGEKVIPEKTETTPEKKYEESVYMKNPGLREIDARQKRNSGFDGGRASQSEISNKAREMAVAQEKAMQIAHAEKEINDKMAEILRLSLEVHGNDDSGYKGYEIDPKDNGIIFKFNDGRAAKVLPKNYDTVIRILKNQSEAKHQKNKTK